MKKVFVLAFLFCGVYAQAQPPAGYYNAANGLTGANLQNALKNIIDGHNVRTYNNLWTDFKTTDKRTDNVNRVWDIYSDRPGQTPAYYYFFESDQCGSYSQEGDCYNREHSYPQSHFGGMNPAYTDLFHLYPTDGYVNGKRGNEPYAKVGNASFVSENGSKLGSSITPGFTGIAFEPIDSFKGDLARTYFYMVTRYKGNSSFLNWEMANGTTLLPWAAAMLLQWHHLDPVSKKEIDRNNAIYGIQHNRNPFIDHPEWADCIWGSSNCGTTSTGNLALSNKIHIYPNPASDVVSINLPTELDAQYVAIVALDGSSILDKKLSHFQPTIQLPLNKLHSGVYFLKIVTDKGVVVKKLVKE